MKTTCSCPTCDEDIDLDYSENQIECLDCGDVFRVNTDYDFEDGMWRNLSTLKKIGSRLEKMAEMREIASEGER
jgi:hypothetical protein